MTSWLFGSRRSSSTVFLVGTILSLSPFMTSTGWWMLARSAGFCRPHRWMALSWARNEPMEMALSRSFVRSSSRARNSFPAWRPFGVLVKKRNCLGSWRLLLRDHLGDHAAHREPEQVDLIEADGTDERHGVPGHL